MQIALGMELDQHVNQPKSILWIIWNFFFWYHALSRGISHLKDPLGSVVVKEESPKEYKLKIWEPLSPIDL